MTDDLSEDYLDTFKYYFNVILKPFSRFMVRAIEKIRPLGIRIICPGHGPVLSNNWKKIVDLTEEYANEYLKNTGSGSQNRILVAYVSAYGFTKTAAEQVASGIREIMDSEIDIIDIENISPEDLDARIISASAILVGSPTINQNTLLPVYKLFALINPIRDKGKLAGAFGSFGWSGEAAKIILENLRNLKLKIFEENATFKFYPGGSKQEMLKEYGKKFALKLKEECNKTENPGN